MTLFRGKRIIAQGIKGRNYIPLPIFLIFFFSKPKSQNFHKNKTHGCQTQSEIQFFKGHRTFNPQNQQAIVRRRREPFPQWSSGSSHLSLKIICLTKVLIGDLFLALQIFLHNMQGTRRSLDHVFGIEAYSLARYSQRRFFSYH